MPRADDRELVHIGIKGHAIGLRRADGAEVWRTKLKGSGTVLLYRERDRLFATTGGEIFCLDVTTGALIWTNPLKGMGLGLVTVSAAARDEQATHAYTTVAEEIEQRKRHAAAAGAG